MELGLVRRVVNRDRVSHCFRRSQQSHNKTGEATGTNYSKIKRIHGTGWHGVHTGYNGHFDLSKDALKFVGDTTGKANNAFTWMIQTQQNAYVSGIAQSVIKPIQGEQLHFSLEQRPDFAFKQHRRFLKYIPFHGQNKKRRKISPPPPVFAALHNPVVPTHETLSQRDEQQLQRLSPCQAVNVLQAFLPLVPVTTPASKGFDASTTGDSLAELEGGTSEPAMSSEHSASRTADGRDSLIYLHMKVNADLSRESVRGVCTLQYGIGSDTKLAVFCPDEEAPAALALGANFAGCDALIQKISKGWVGFDKAVAVPSVMPKLLKIAKILGPKKLMPSPKSGTLVTNIQEAVKAIKSGCSVEFRAEGSGDIRVPLGIMGFTNQQLLENCKCIIAAVLKAQPRTRATPESSGSKVFSWPPPHFLEMRAERLHGSSSVKSGEGLPCQLLNGRHIPVSARNFCSQQRQ